MSNNIRSTRSNPAFLSSTGNQERILRNPNLSFPTVYIHKSPGSASSIRHEPIHILKQAFFPLDRESSLPSPTSRAKLAFAAVIPDVEFLQQVCDHTRQEVGEEVARRHEKLLQKATQQAVGNTLWKIFTTSYTGAKGRLKNSFCQFVETVLNDMAETGT